MTSIIHMQNFLSEATDAVITGETLDSVRTRYHINSIETEELIDLIESLNRAMPSVEPELQFKRRLKAELLGEPRPSSVAGRIQRMPARVQFAAVAAIVTTFVVILQRIIMVLAGEAHQRRDREHILPEES